MLISFECPYFHHSYHFMINFHNNPYAAQKYFANIAPPYCMVEGLRYLNIKKIYKILQHIYYVVGISQIPSSLLPNLKCEVYQRQS